MNPLLKPVELKLKRADEHAQTLLGFVAAAGNHSPMQFRTEYLPGRLGFNLYIDKFPQVELLDSYGLELSEFLHMLRSSIDNLAFSLARLHQDPPPQPKRIAFPIFDDEAKYLGDKMAKNTLAQLSNNVADLIAKTQPFQRSKPGSNGTVDGDPLLVLHKLNNIDKHQIPNVAFIAPAEINHLHQVEFLSDEDASLNVPPDLTINIEPIAPGALMMTYRSKTPLVKASGKVDMKAILCTLVDGKWRQLDEIVKQQLWYTNLVVDAFRPFFLPSNTL